MSKKEIKALQERYFKQITDPYLLFFTSNGILRSDRSSRKKLEEVLKTKRSANERARYLDNSSYWNKYFRSFMNSFEYLIRYFPSQFHFLQFSSPYLRNHINSYTDLTTHPDQSHTAFLQWLSEHPTPKKTLCYRKIMAVRKAFLKKNS